MTLLDELQALPIGQTRTVSWDELRPYFPGRSDKQRWKTMMRWGSPYSLDVRADNINADRLGNIIGADLTFERRP